MRDDLDFDPSRPLFLPSGKRFSVASSLDAISLAYTENSPVLIYIHGRAKGRGEPRKSVEDNVYRALGEYGVSVIGFTWDADDSGYDPSRPAASVDDFDRFLADLGDYLNDRAEVPRPSLLTHSMGGLLVSELAKDDRLGSDRGSLFYNIVFSAAAMHTKRHDQWLKKIGVCDHSYVLVNPHDHMLRFAGLLFRPNMLGRELRSSSVAPGRATYVGLENAGVNHRYFASPTNDHLHNFFQQALTGERVNFTAIAEPGRMREVNVQSILASDGGSREALVPDPTVDPITGLPIVD